MAIEAAHLSLLKLTNLVINPLLHPNSQWLVRGGDKFEICQTVNATIPDTSRQSRLLTNNFIENLGRLVHRKIEAMMLVAAFFHSVKVSNAIDTKKQFRPLLVFSPITSHHCHTNCFGTTTYDCHGLSRHKSLVVINRLKARSIAVINPSFCTQII